MRVIERKLSCDCVGIDRQQSDRWDAGSRVLALSDDHPKQLGEDVAITCKQNPGRPILLDERWHEIRRVLADQEPSSGDIMVEESTTVVYCDTIERRLGFEHLGK